MQTAPSFKLLSEIESLKSELLEAQDAISAIKSGSVDAFAIRKGGRSEVFTLQSLDFAYRVLIEKFSEGALNLTPDGLIVYSNSYFSALLGLSNEKVVGTNFFDYVAPESREIFRDHFTLGLESVGKTEITLSVNNKNIPVYVSLTSLRPQLATVGMIITDLTEKKHNEQRVILQTEKMRQKNLELEHLNKSLEQFASIASHDLQEPLRKIQTFTSLLEQRFAVNLPAEAKGLVAKIKGSSERMSLLIKDVLNFSRVVNSADLFVETDLNRVLNNVLGDFDLIISEKRAVIIKNNLPVIETIPVQANQLFYNLISNALKFTKADTSPVITISSKELLPEEVEKDSKLNSQLAYTEICFRDNGIGFEQQFSEQIFSIFECLNDRKQYSGTGIGLALCRKIAEHHQGSIHAEAAENNGAAFYILLPLKQSNIPAAV
ncbi:MAG: PAS domain S-box protein [Chitinophagaceae bacterium]|nr:PAS domain S-box protein [Chitinophagaceae bacterium]